MTKCFHCDKELTGDHIVIQSYNTVSGELYQTAHYCPGKKPRYRLGLNGQPAHYEFSRTRKLQGRD